MPKTGTSIELPLTLPSGRGRQKALESALRDAVKHGRLQPGEVLPSTRSLAADLGVSRRLVVESYEQLISEGYLVARERRRTAVAELAAQPRPETAAPVAEAPSITDDWRPGTPDLDAFPARAWARRVREALGDPATLGYGDPAGLSELRAELASYLRRVRAVACDAGQIRICSGLSGAITLWSLCLRARDVRRVALEHPGPTGLLDRLSRLGLEVVPLPVDEHGACTHLLAELDVGAVVMTPAHQFPLGWVLAPERRAAVVAWARDHLGWIFEDDYDAEYRFGGKPIGSLQGLAPDRVATSSSVSKTLAPGLRLGWLVLPPELVDPAADLTLDLGQPGPEQRALARMLAAGDYDRHLRRQRRVYQQRRSELDEIVRRWPELTALGSRAGLHVMVGVAEGWGVVEELRERARQRRVELASARPFYWSGFRAGDPAGIVLGYAALSQGRWSSALASLGRCLEAQFGSSGG